MRRIVWAGRGFRFLCLAGLCIAAPVPATGQASGDHGSDGALRAVPLRGASATAVQVDGRLDEPIWRQAPVATGFRQREPDEGAPASEVTEVRVVYDDEYLYIAVRALDGRPDRIIARQLARDASIGSSSLFGSAAGDDAIQIVLDTFHDRRNAYYFATNPRGVEVDGLVSDEDQPDLNWDGVWQVEARRTAEGWTAEFAIPFLTLRFPEGVEEQTWGFNIQRVIGRKSEQSLWRAWSRDNEGLFRISRAGELTGLVNLERGLDLRIKPYALGRTSRDFVLEPGASAELGGDLGLDAKLGLGSGLVLDLTVNTDFAQVEADDEQIDLTRFNLFFPEKREFFLENAGIFEFGAPQFFGPPHFLLFFSRRIGLRRRGFGEAAEVPILGGARLTGRAGAQTIGLLSVVTGEESEVGAPLTSYGVARIKRDIGERSYIGAMGTHRLEEGGFENVGGGVDASLWLTDRLVANAFYGRTTQSGPGGEDGAWRGQLDYTSDWFGWVAEVMRIGRDIEPGIGFVRRRDMVRYDLGGRLTPRPPIDGLRKIDIFGSLEYIESAETGAIRDRIWGLTLSPELDSGDDARFELDRRFQRLDEGFELTPGVEVPSGDYEDWRFEASVNSSRNRPLTVELDAGVEGFWGGDRWQLGGSVAYSSPHFGLELGYTHNDIEVPAGAFTTDLVQARINLAANTRLFGNALIQYNSQTEMVSANLRLDFIHREGSDLFVVFNERRDVRRGRWDPRSRSFIVKLTYLHWF